MDSAAFLTGLTCRYYGDLTVDDTPGGVGFDPDKLSLDGLPPKLVVVNVEGGDFRYRENGGDPAANSGVLRVNGDEFLVPGPEGARNFRAIRTGIQNSTLRYHVYF